MARKVAKKPTAFATKQVRDTKKESKQKGKRKTSSTMGTLGWALKVFVVIAAVTASYYIRQYSDMRAVHYIARTDVKEHQRFNVTCALQQSSTLSVPGCHLENGTMCGRAIIDNFVSPHKVDDLRKIAEIGMQGRSARGGPTIMDIDTGFVRDSEGLVNIYQPEQRIPDEDKPGVKHFSRRQFKLYKDVVEKVRLAVMQEFDLEVLYFSAPTFITRLVGNASWTPVDIHDEYWHPHVDKENTKHYDYSGLLYLSDYGEDFTGGVFSFIDESTETIIEPARGRLLIFTAGSENLHAVRMVETGTRYALSLWFSCDQIKEAPKFLDSTMHKIYRRS